MWHFWTQRVSSVCVCVCVYEYTANWHVYTLKYHKELFQGMNRRRHLKLIGKTLNVSATKKVFALLSEKDY